MADGGGVGPVIGSGSTGYQTSHDSLCLMLRKGLVDGVRARRGSADGISSVESQAVLTLDSLLRDQPVDQWGRCRSCRRPRSVRRARWHHGQVHSTATLGLHRLDEVLLLSLLADELGLATAPPPMAPGPARR
jgi:hypothetical protein